jgi:hypothetical protein
VRAIDGHDETFDTEFARNTYSLPSKSITGTDMPKAYWIATYREVKDADKLAAYAKQKNVGLILWVVWKSLDDKLIPALDRFEKWGVKGIKVDFMQRSDQILTDYYYKVSREAAKRHMLVDFHGDQKPASMTRTWPNLISTEGVRGMEWSKWSAESEPEHNVTLPFTRMFLGPMDYTPGAMRNATKTAFAPINHQPMAMGTRCHQLAMYVVFESPLQMLADSPANYMREPEAMEFLKAVPTEWDETKALDGRIADYVLVARRNGNDWYVGAMSDWTGRDLDAAGIEYLYRLYTTDVIPARPHLKPEGVELAIQMTAAIEPAGAAMKPQDLTDPTLVPDLEKEGRCNF